MLKQLFQKPALNPASNPALNHSSAQSASSPSEPASAESAAAPVPPSAADNQPRAATATLSRPELPLLEGGPADAISPDSSIPATASDQTPEKNKPQNKPAGQPDKAVVGLLLAARQRLGQFLSRPKGRVASILALLGVGTGFAFTQVAPASLSPATEGASVPLSRRGDAAAEAVLSSENLFLTHQLFYRKLEALGRISNGGVAQGGQGSAAPEAAKGAKGAAKADKRSGSKNGAVAATNQATKAASGPPDSERVVAAAPPAPVIQQPAYTGSTIDTALEMRVAVAKDVEAIAFATSGSGAITDLDGNVLKSLAPETGALAEIGSGGVVVDGAPVPSAFWVYPDEDGFVAIGSSWYRGRVLIALREDGLIAVNYVLLGDYLYSVVGTEMSPSWSLEALKAQAVAARSYALTHNIHPASEAYFDLDNTERFQAYKGLEREADTTQLAVQTTAGEFISYDGGIVESLYAASQAIVDDAHSGSGMSQLGAKDLADQGYSYTDILGHYYPDTALGRLEIDGE